ncbi:transglutaminase family protein [Salipiger sp. PrR002]|uniref:transglutaminase-like domain-containing protein n=1 Tax=Salipiger sp. PrR002 TaxID=2706489 RepID=UPI0013B9BC2D|nr:transglutaminase family protein [Salipiger sp. PrR002]NDW01248.1 transglutaminase family protein [Salipiger sp. PrR002]NDW58108.1 transglutaminase family protein [Salipiger sp. PrR004]
MRMMIDVEMHYQFAMPNTVTLVIEAAETAGQTVNRAELDLGDAQVTRIAGDMDLGSRLWVQVPGDEMRLSYRAEVEVTRPDLPLETLRAAPLHELTTEAAPFIRPSRYCLSDKFVAFVARRFGHLQGGAKVLAIRDWIEAELDYVPGSSDADTHVLETFAARQGVCRDYAHLFCAMVRAAQIPARMVAAYGPCVTPPDFHALAEVWLEGRWHPVDPTGMCRPDALALIAVGRDAYDIAFMESQAPATLVRQEVSVTEIPG